MFCLLRSWWVRHQATQLPVLVHQHRRFIQVRMSSRIRWRGKSEKMKRNEPTTLLGATTLFCLIEIVFDSWCWALTPFYHGRDNNASTRTSAWTPPASVVAAVSAATTQVVTIASAHVDTDLTKPAVAAWVSLSSPLFCLRSAVFKWSFLFKNLFCVTVQLKRENKLFCSLSMVLIDTFRCKNWFVRYKYVCCMKILQKYS